MKIVYYKLFRKNKTFNISKANNTYSCDAEKVSFGLYLLLLTRSTGPLHPSVCFLLYCFVSCSYIVPNRDY